MRDRPMHILNEHNACWQAMCNHGLLGGVDGGGGDVYCGKKVVNRLVMIYVVGPTHASPVSPCAIWTMLEMS